MIAYNGRETPTRGREMTILEQLLGNIGNDSVLPQEVIAALRASFTVRKARRTVFPYAFAVPAGVLRDGALNTGCTEIMSAWYDAVAERF